jgi:mannose-1-phosphate guanylyltransferase
MLVENENPHAIMIVSPSDHLISDTVGFREIVLAAAKIAEEKYGIVTIGINPTYPATGYGYVKTDAKISGEKKINQYKVNRFLEKPDEVTAAEYLKHGGYFWNSGMFIFKISVFLEAVQKFAPEIYAGLRKIQAEIGCSSFEKILETVYRKFESISVDYGIMEHARNIYLVEGNFGWNDLGSWESVYQISKKDKNGNIESGSGEALFIDANNAYVHTDEGLVALIGLDDVIVVRDGNAVLVCHREKAEEVKKVVEFLKERDNQHYL